MKIKIAQDKLARSLNNVSRIAGGKASLPILSNVLIRVDDNKVSLVTTNLDMAVVSYLPSVGSENGVVTVPAKLMAEFVGNLPRGERVDLEADDTKVTIKAGGYSSCVNGASAEDFPELPEIDEEKVVKFKIGVEDFKTGLSQVMVAVSNDTTRPALTGVYFNTFENGLYLAATDGYRLAERKLIDKVQAEVMAIVPAASLRSVLALIGDDVQEIEILFDDSQVRFRLGDVEVTSKLVDGSFPDYRQLIPKETEIKVTLPRDELVRITKLAALFAREVGGSIVCETNVENGVFSVASVANELGENKSEIKTEVETDGKVTLNSRFLLDVLNILGGKKVDFGFSNKLDPVMLNGDKDTDYTHIIMPLKG